jgi:hypothetical protein
MSDYMTDLAVGTVFEKIQLNWLVDKNFQILLQKKYYGIEVKNNNSKIIGKLLK